MSVIVVFPGQGSQKPGMGKELAAAFPVARDTFAAVDDALGMALSTLCFEGPADELTQTRNAQPALYAHGAAAWAALCEAVGPALGNQVVAAAGHSLGELTAYHAAGTLSLADGATLVRRRGEIMYEAGLSRPGTMAAILGTLSTPVDALCEQASHEAGLVVAANYNADEQTVVSGEIAGVERAMELAKAAGAKRAVKLVVSGAFHSPLMAPAAEAFGQAIASTTFVDPAFPVYSNVTEQAVTHGTTAKDVVLRQLTSPVRWVGEVRAMAAAHPDALYVELGPGNVLGGLISRIVPGTRTMACGTPADIEAVAQAISHALTS